MRSAGNFNSEWGYLAPVPSFMRTLRVVLVATAIGATAGAAVVLSLIDRPVAEHDRTASISAHAIVTSAQAAPAAAVPAPSSATAALAAPVSATRAVPTTVAATAQAQPAAPGAPQVKSPAALPQVAMEPPPVVTPPTQAAPKVTPAVMPQAAIQRQTSSAPPQASVAIDFIGFGKLRRSWRHGSGPETGFRICLAVGAVRNRSCACGIDRPGPDPAADDPG